MVDGWRMIGDLGLAPFLHPIQVELAQNWHKVGSKGVAFVIVELAQVPGPYPAEENNAA